MYTSNPKLMQKFVQQYPEVLARETQLLMALDATKASLTRLKAKKSKTPSYWVLTRIGEIESLREAIFGQLNELMKRFQNFSMQQSIM